MSNSLDELNKAFPHVDKAEIDEVRRLELDCEDSENKMCDLIEKLVKVIHVRNGDLDLEIEE